jgi:hypothetical protein
MFHAAEAALDLQDGIGCKVVSVAEARMSQAGWAAEDRRGAPSCLLQETFAL